jgi:hypothetical protein
MKVETSLVRNSALLATLAALIVVSPVWAAQAGKSPVKVFILAGQSKMEGQGKVTAKPDSHNQGQGTLEYLVKAPESAARYKHLVDKDGKWIVRDDVWISFGDRDGKLTVAYGSKGAIGPELQFGNVLGDYYGNQVLLIKCAWGGKSLSKNFRPPSSGGEVGDAYIAMVKQVRDVLANLKTHFPDYDGKGHEIVGFGWFQGWQDGCNEASANEYEKNLANFIRDVRKEFGVKDMPFVIGKSGFNGWEQKIPRRLKVMEAQAAVAQYAEFKGNVLCVETRDFFRPPEVSPTRFGYHFNCNAETFFLVGDAMGKAMVKLLEKD